MIFCFESHSICLFLTSISLRQMCECVHARIQFIRVNWRRTTRRKKISSTNLKCTGDVLCLNITSLCCSIADGRCLPAYNRISNVGHFQFGRLDSNSCLRRWLFFFSSLRLSFFLLTCSFIRLHPLYFILHMTAILNLPFYFVPLLFYCNKQSRQLVGGLVCTWARASLSRSGVCVSVTVITECCHGLYVYLLFLIVCFKVTK